MITTGRHNGTATASPSAIGSVDYGTAVATPRDAYKDVPILQQPTWKNEIAAYFYLGGISGGASVIAGLAELFGGRSLKGLARTAHLVAWLTLLPCPLLLIMDLGVRVRFHHMLRIFKPSSPMNLGSWLLTGHGAITSLAVLRTLAERIPLVGGLLRLAPAGPIAAAEVPFGLGLGGYTGVLIGTTSVPVWSESPFLGALFMASAMSTGAAAVSLAGSLAGESRAEHEVLRTISLGSGLAELALMGTYLATSGSASRPLLTGVHAPMTLAGAAATAGALALESRWVQLPLGGKLLSQVAALSTLLAGVLLRFSVVHAGHTSAKDREATLRATAPSSSAPGWGPARVG